MLGARMYERVRVGVGERVYTLGPKGEVGVGVCGGAKHVYTCEPRRLGAEDVCTRKKVGA